MQVDDNKFMADARQRTRRASDLADIKAYREKQTAVGLVMDSLEEKAKRLEAQTGGVPAEWVMVALVVAWVVYALSTRVPT